MTRDDMAPFNEWRWLAMLVVAILSLIIAIGWLDIVRGRQLTILENNQQWVIREVIQLREQVRQLERARGR